MGGWVDGWVGGWVGGWMTERGKFYKLLAEVIILVWTLVHFLILEIH